MCLCVCACVRACERASVRACERASFFFYTVDAVEVGRVAAGDAPEFGARIVVPKLHNVLADVPAQVRRVCVLEVEAVEEHVCKRHALELHPAPQHQARTYAARARAGRAARRAPRAHTHTGWKRFEAFLFQGAEVSVWNGS